jgi:hypothetical protein
MSEKDAVQKGYLPANGTGKAGRQDIPSVRPVIERSRSGGSDLRVIAGFKIGLDSGL